MNKDAMTELKAEAGKLSFRLWGKLNDMRYEAVSAPRKTQKQIKRLLALSYKIEQELEQL